MINTFSVILLTYTIGVHLISILSPIPFIGFGVVLLGFPLSLKISLKELIFIEAFGMIVGLALKFGNFISYYSMIAIGPDIYQIYIITGFTIGMIFVITLAPILSALIMKLLARRFTPKRIRVILNET